MTRDGMIIQVLRFNEVEDAQVPLPRLVEVLPKIPGFRQGLFLEPTEKKGALGVMLWDGERALGDGFASLRQRLGVQRPDAEVQVYRVVGLEPPQLPAATFASATTREFISPAHEAAWEQNIRDRILPALRTLDGFVGVVWGDQADGGAGFAVELWSSLPPEGQTHQAVSRRPVAPTLDTSLLDTPVLRERFRVIASASAAVAA
jgi:hypothetical protein